jgi:hypothetical protein
MRSVAPGVRADRIAAGIRFNVLRVGSGTPAPPRSYSLPIGASGTVSQKAPERARLTARRRLANLHPSTTHAANLKQKGVRLKGRRNSNYGTFRVPALAEPGPFQKRRL